MEKYMSEKKAPKGAARKDGQGEGRYEQGTQDGKSFDGKKRVRPKVFSKGFSKARPRPSFKNDGRGADAQDRFHKRDSDSSFHERKFSERKSSSPDSRGDFSPRRSFRDRDDNRFERVKRNDGYGAERGGRGDFERHDKPRFEKKSFDKRDGERAGRSYQGGDRKPFSRDGGYGGDRKDFGRKDFGRSDFGRSRDDRPRSDRPRSDRPYSDRPRTDRPYSDKPRSDRFGDNRPYNNDRQAPRERFTPRNNDERGGQGFRERRPERDFNPRHRDGDRERPRFKDGEFRDRRAQRNDYERGERKPHFERDGKRFEKPSYEKRPYKEHSPYGERAPRKEFRERTPDYRPEYVERTDFAPHNEPMEHLEQHAVPMENMPSFQELYEHDAKDASLETPVYAESSEGLSFQEQSSNSPAYTYEQNERGEHGERSRGRFGREDRGDRGARPARGDKRPPLRETIMNMDKDMLKMLARRTNILEKMSARTGKLEAREEKELRISWEKSATQMTRDPRIIHQLFSLFQEITFSAKPEAGMAKRSGFNLAPPHLPVDIRMQAHLVSRRSRLFLALAGASGSACRMTPSLLDDGTVECIKMFNQCATSLAWDDDGTLISRAGGGLSLPDKVIYVGDDMFNFFLLLGHYVGGNTRAKFTGEARLKEFDLTSVRSFLPMLGARLSNVMPGTSGFPIRLECSGIFSSTVDIPADLPADCILGLLLAAPFWENPMQFNLHAHPAKEAIIEEALAVLTPCKAMVHREQDSLLFTPAAIKTPIEPELGMDLQFVAYILALPFCLGGKVQLNGLWPVCEPAELLEALFHAFGMDVHKDTDGISTSHEVPESVRKRLAALAANVAADKEATEVTEATEAAEATEATEVTEMIEATEELEENAQENGNVSTLEDADDKVLEEYILPHSALLKDARFVPLYAALSYIIALRYEDKKRIVFSDAAPLEEMEAFFNYLGFEYTDNALVRAHGYHDPDLVFTADSPAWALAFALAAAAKPHIKLSNPGIMTNLCPQFWNLYNALPSFDIKKNVSEQKHDKPVRRRIIAADQEGTGGGDSPDRDNA